jgi:hypothetical protein
MGAFDVRPLARGGAFEINILFLRLLIIQDNINTPVSNHVNIL